MEIIIIAIRSKHLEVFFSFHCGNSYMLQEEQPLKMLIRDVPTTVTEKDVAMALQEQGIDTLNARRRRSAGPSSATAASSLGTFKDDTA